MDPLGNKLSSTDESSNPIHHHGTAGHHDQHNGGHGDQHGIAGHVDQHTGGHGDQHGVAGQVGHQTGGYGEQGVKDKVKEKLPGGHKDGQNPQLHHDQGVAAGAQTQEKKGTVEKIKEKLPGSH